MEFVVYIILISESNHNPTNHLTQARTTAGKAYCLMTVLNWVKYTPLPQLQVKVLTPKNPEISWPHMPVERMLTDTLWPCTLFFRSSVFELHTEVLTLVDTSAGRVLPLFVCQHSFNLHVGPADLWVIWSPNLYLELRERGILYPVQSCPQAVRLACSGSGLCQVIGRIVILFWNQSNENNNFH